MDFDGLVLVFHFGWWYYLHTEFYDLSGTSIIESVVLRSGTLLQQDRGTHGLTAVVVAYIRPVQDQASQHSSMEWEGLMRSPSQLRSYLELMAAGGERVSSL